MSKLFEPVPFGNVHLRHRIVLAPMTRYKANEAHVHGDLALQFYTQRASVPGTLLFTEGTFISPQAGGYPFVPGIWSEEQITAWKKITDAVHARGSFIYMQLWALGRGAFPAELEKHDPPFPLVSSGDVPLPGSDLKPRPMTVEEIREYVEMYATAASNAVHKAGFDGVEIHGTNGYLVDQFLQDVTNNRTDAYGGSIENRCRFALEVIDAVVKAVGQKAVGIRISPWGRFNGMRMEEPLPTFAHLLTCIRDQYPDFGHVHVIEPRISGNNDQETDPNDSNDALREIWGSRTYISAGGYDKEEAAKLVDSKGGLVSFGRHFLANPDLPLRFKKNIPLNPYNRQTFWVKGSGAGYIDYPFAEGVNDAAAAW